MSRARDLSKLGNPNVIKADENSVGFGTQVAGNPANPDSSLISAGIVSATAFYGDGSNLDGVASAGLGTALSEIEFNPLTVIYQTSDTLSINQTVTVDPPDSTSNVAYTQYSEVKLEDGADLIIADGDDFIPDILGLSTEGSGGSGSTYGNGVFGTIYADNIERSDGRGAPSFPQGANVVGVLTAASGSFSGNISIGGTLTYEDVTNVDSIGIVTARNGIKVTTGGIDVTAGGIDVTGDSSIAGNLTLPTADAKLRLKDGNNYLQFLDTDKTFKFNNSWGAGEFTFHVNGGERLRIGSAGQIGLGGANYGTSGQVLTSQGGSAAPQWATPAAGGAYEVVSTHALTGSTSTIDSNGWSNSYAMYKVVMNDIYYSNTDFKVYFRVYMDSTSGNAGTLKTGNAYGYGSMDPQESWSGMSGVPRQGNWSSYHKLAYNNAITILHLAEYNFGMQTNVSHNNVNSYWHGTLTRNASISLADTSIYNADNTEFLTGVRIYFYDTGGSTAINPSQGRVTILRMKYS